MAEPVSAKAIPPEYLDKDFGRDAYINDCVQRVVDGETVLVTLGGTFSLDSLPEPLKSKYCALSGKETGTVYFPGFSGAKEEIVKRVSEFGTAKVKNFCGGSGSDMIGASSDSAWSLDGYFISIVKKPVT